METLDEYNERRRRELQEIAQRQHLAGVSCDRCGSEMHVTNPGVLLMSHPPQRQVHCPRCKQTGTQVT